MQEAYYKNNKVHYTTKGYEFIFKNEDQVYYRTLITRPSHLQIVRNDTKYSNSELLDKIIAKWFAEENESIRQHNNAKRRESNAKKRGE